MFFHNCRNGYDAMEYVSTWGCVVVTLVRAPCVVGGGAMVWYRTLYTQNGSGEKQHL
jgi:hypothetical protein